MSVFNGAYVTGLFDSGNNCDCGPTAAQLAASQLTDYVFWSVHVSANGDLGYNNVHLADSGTPNPSTIACMKQVLAAASAAGRSPRIWLSIGAGGVQDFSHIASILSAGGAAKANMLANLDAVATQLGAYGFDYDNEDALSNVEVIVDLTVELFNLNNAYRFSYCPYFEPNYWIQCLQGTFSKLGSQPVEGFNLQCYSGGTGNDPASWVSQVASAGSSSTGISDAAALIRPGYAVEGGDYPQMTPADMTAALQQAGVKGGWIWNSEAVLKNNDGSPSIADYAAAIAAGS